MPWHENKWLKFTNSTLFLKQKKYTSKANKQKHSDVKKGEYRMIVTWENSFESQTFISTFRCLVLTEISWGGWANFCPILKILQTINRRFLLHILLYSCGIEWDLFWALILPLYPFIKSKSELNNVINRPENSHLQSAF